MKFVVCWPLKIVSLKYFYHSYIFLWSNSVARAYVFVFEQFLYSHILRTSSFQHGYESPRFLEHLLALDLSSNQVYLSPKSHLGMGHICRSFWPCMLASLLQNIWSDSKLLQKIKVQCSVIKAFAKFFFTGRPVPSLQKRGEKASRPFHSGGFCTYKQ